MGQTIPTKESLNKEFTEALRTNKLEDLKEVVDSEMINEGNLINEAIKGKYFDAVKFLIETCSTYIYKFYRPKN